MIVVKLQGGLGNQMFQYAAGKCLAEKRHTQVKVDGTFLKADPKGAYTKRHFELDIFEAEIRVAAEPELAPFYRTVHHRLLRNLQNKMPFLFRHRYYDERQIAFDPSFFDLPKDAYLDGYFQSELYFRDIAGIIRREFTFKGPMPAACEAWLQKINASNSVSVHIRRGDYVSNPADTTFHGTCPPAYYEAALAHIAASQKNTELFVFSDDLDWCKKNLLFRQPTHFVSTGLGANHWDMLLMSTCRHQVIANSSFSWWGAWLNHKPGKIVVAPKAWFGAAHMNQNDIIPADWKIL